MPSASRSALHFRNFSVWVSVIIPTQISLLPKLRLNQNNAVTIPFFRCGNHFILSVRLAIVGVIPIKEIAILDVIVFTQCLLIY